MAAKPKSGEAGKASISNRRAWHDYNIIDTFEAGIELVGAEVKSLRAGNASLQDAYCQIQGGQLVVMNMYIKPYEQANRFNVEERRPRRLLVHKGEILRLDQRMREKGITLVPLKAYFTRGWAKLEIGLATGKKQYDKREAIKQRDIERDLRRQEE